MMKKRVGVLMGGPSSEHDISIKSGKAVYKALLDKGIDAIPIELVELAQAKAMNGYKEEVKRLIQSSNIEIAFIALHGGFGEDGAIQELLEEMRIPYTGSKVAASRLGIDKIASRNIFKRYNIPMPRYMVVQGRTSNIQDIHGSALKELGTPLVVKPSREGSSIGLTIVDSEKDFSKALDDAFRYSRDVLIEEYVRGREITVGIFDDRPLPVVEIIPKKRFFDFDAKYKKGLTEYRVPAEIEKGKYVDSQKTALMAHKALAARFFSRVDMILSEKGVPVVLELNTIPGLTETSLLPKAACSSGIDFQKLVLKITESALW
ncbi:MAG: D-alanine--D-alanine ligase [Candidatus Omnitrophica bacterium]|nr:D-alanine--D-alanine ligase [Candidatus Omnitrophota bacterium]